MNREEIVNDLDRCTNFDDVIYTVERDRIWVSGMNSHCRSIAEDMVHYLVYVRDVPCGLIYKDPPLGHYSGVAFNWYDRDELDGRPSDFDVPDFEELELVYPDK